MNKLSIFFFIIISIFIFSCKEKTLFTEIDAEDSGITFANRIDENDTLNILTFEYVYNGGGVAMGDFNNDSLVDIYFTANTRPNKLYLNRTQKGEKLHFEDVTEKANVDGNGRWSSGIALVDINNDNLLDIYVCATARKTVRQRTNILYVNQGVGKDGVPIFKDMAQEYGIADTTHTTNAAFFDYDNDGDLDLYLVVNEMDDDKLPNKFQEKGSIKESKRTDRLYKNFNKEEGKIRFADVSKEAGIFDDAFGLGINITDINQDGWKDIYVTNDFLTNDLLYINNQNGTFSEKAIDYFKHTSYSAMGNDIEDINNDGLVDIIALDMMPETNYRKKMMTPANSYVTYQNNDKFGYLYQYPRNTLQLNRGKNPNTGQTLFSEISLLAGVAQTDWSWTPMVTDFDNDGFRDIIITNGFPRDITDLDFLAYRNEVNSLMSKSMLLDYVPKVKLKNYAYKNMAKSNAVQFEDVTDKWGINNPTSANGAAYADLDNDGDLDYVVNNINDSASVFQNNLTKLKPEESNYLGVRLKGSQYNINSIGAWIEIIYGDNQKQVYENNPYRGYLSSIEPKAHFGLGKHRQVKQVKVIWPGGKSIVVKQVKANQTITLDEKNATTSLPDVNLPKANTFFEEITQKVTLDYKHEEEDYIDFNVQKLLPHKLSQFGPSMSVGDINADGIEDVFVAGSKNHKGKFLLQQPNGTFKTIDLLPGKDGSEKLSEDMGTLLFDADKDGDLDLYIVSGSNESAPNAPEYQDKLYINDGKGHFIENINALPKFLKSGSCVKAADFDKDGDLDLFVGGRVEPNMYPKPVNSYILLNDKGIFRDVTTQFAPILQNIGMICDVSWSDFDNDGWLDLVMAGEFMPITILKNNQGKSFLIHESEELKSKVGWWNSVASGDFDNDGDIDYIFGNNGLNTLLKASNKLPVSIYAKDFNNDGFFDAIPTVFYKDTEGDRKEFPFNTRDDLAKQFIQTRQRFQNYAKFSQATIKEILKPEELKDAIVVRATFFESSYMENLGNGKFSIKALPIEAQFAPIFGIITQDFDQDGNLDILLAGNDYGIEVSVGRNDAFQGLMLRGDGKGNFLTVNMQKSGFCADGDAKSLVKVLNPKGKLMTLVSQNRNYLKLFEYRYPTKNIPLTSNDIFAWIHLKNGKKRKEEFSFGNSFLSQSGRNLVLSSDVKLVEIVDFKGNKRQIQ